MDITVQCTSLKGVLLLAFAHSVFILAMLAAPEVVFFPMELREPG